MGFTKKCKTLYCIRVITRTRYRYRPVEERYAGAVSDPFPAVDALYYEANSHYDELLEKYGRDSVYMWEDYEKNLVIVGVECRAASYWCEYQIVEVELTEK